jgi:YVTN family beta-propeller protein
VTATIPVPVAFGSIAVAVTPDGSRVYLTGASGSVLVVDASTNAITATIAVGGLLWGVAVTPDGSKVYVANEGANSVSVIDVATNKLIATIPVGVGPLAFGVFIRPALKFAGMPGQANCYGQSVSTLGRGLNGAAAALGFSSVRALQEAIMAYCGG